jgi:hypothetical protein
MEGAENLELYKELVMRIFNKASCCHSGLSGIFLANNLCNSALKKDSGQAGMTGVGRYSYP